MKAPFVFALFSFMVPLLTLTALVLFQTGVLYSMGLTMLTSDMMVQGIMYALAITAILGFVAMIKSAMVNKAIRVSAAKESAESKASSRKHKNDEQHNEKTAQASIEPEQDLNDTSANDSSKMDEEEPEEPESAPAIMPEQLIEEEQAASVASVAIDVPEETVSQNSTADADMETIEDILNGTKKGDTHEMVIESAAEENKEPEQDEVSMGASVEEDEPAISAEAEEAMDAEAEGEKKNSPQLTDFELAVKKLMDKAGVSESLYVIEEYKEDAICLIHDDAHYFVYKCKNNNAEDVEYFPISQEKEVAKAFTRRVQQARDCA